MEMPEQPHAATSGNRRADRAPFDASVVFRAGTRKAAVTVRDISPLGARIGGVFLAHIDDRFFLTLPGLAAIEARVAWVNDFEFGCEFAQPLNPVVLESLMHRR